MTCLQSVKCLLMTLHFSKVKDFSLSLPNVNYDLETINNGLTMDARQSL